MYGGAGPVPALRLRERGAGGDKLERGSDGLDRLVQSRGGGLPEPSFRREGLRGLPGRLLRRIPGGRGGRDGTLCGRGLRQRGGCTAHDGGGRRGGGAAGTGGLHRQPVRGLRRLRAGTVRCAGAGRRCAPGTIRGVADLPRSGGGPGQLRCVLLGRHAAGDTGPHRVRHRA